MSNFSIIDISFNPQPLDGVDPAVSKPSFNQQPTFQFATSLPTYLVPQPLAQRTLVCPQ